MAGPTIDGSPTEVVRAFWAAFRSGDVQHAFGYWSADAVWRLTGRHARAGDYTPSDYAEMLAAFSAEFPEYSGEFLNARNLGELALFDVRSRNGPGPGESQGILIYRVRRGLIEEGWAIAANHGGRYPF
jgi:hypothetical protein